MTPEKRKEALHALKDLHGGIREVYEVMTEELKRQGAMRNRFAYLLWKDGMTMKEIGDECGVSTTAVRGWIQLRDRQYAVKA